MSKLILAGFASLAMSGTAVAQTLGTSDVLSIVSTSRTNELRFTRDYKGRTFDGMLRFSSTSQNLLSSSYIVYFDVAYCSRVDDKETLNRLTDWNKGQMIHVRGVIEDTTLGSIELNDCSFPR